MQRKNEGDRTRCAVSLQLVKEVTLAHRMLRGGTSSLAVCQTSVGDGAEHWTSIEKGLDPRERGLLGQTVGLCIADERAAVQEVRDDPELLAGQATERLCDLGKTRDLLVWNGRDAR